jgi:hypothetical protein
MPRTATEPLFANEVAEATGLAPMFANGVLERCCKRAGIQREAMKPCDLERLLPELESALLVYKTGREVMAALDRLKRLATKGPSLTQSFIRQRPAFVARRKFAFGG